jgi:ribonuclease HI
MELQAAIEALAALTQPSEVVFHTDSEYLRLGITRWIESWAAAGWIRKGGKAVPNADLWRQLWPLVKQHQIEWRWVRGHTGEPMNERVDELARRARLEITPSTRLIGDLPKLYLRASCKGNPGPGGWGVVLERGDEREQLSGSAPETTNNRMELTAALEGLLLLPAGSSVQLFTSSDYLFQGATRWMSGWRKRNWLKMDGKPVANADLWQALDQLLKAYSVRWINAKGKDHPAMSEAGRMASAAIHVV